MSRKNHQGETIVNWGAWVLLLGSVAALARLGVQYFDASALEHRVAQEAKLEARANRTDPIFGESYELRADRALVADYEGQTARAVETLVNQGPALGLLAIVSTATLIGIRKRRRARLASDRAARLPAESEEFSRSLDQFEAGEQEP